MLNPYTTNIRWIFFGTALGAIVLWFFFVHIFSRYKKVYMLTYFLMGEEADIVNKKLGMIQEKYPWWLGWLKEIVQIKGFLFENTFVSKLPFSEIRELYKRECRILLYITFAVILFWLAFFAYIIDQI
jgi:hypothetical protein